MLKVWRLNVFANLSAVLGSVDVWFPVALERFSRQIKAFCATNSELFEHEITQRCREKRTSPSGLAAFGLTLR
jgi:hypothetical protein